MWQHACRENSCILYKKFVQIIITALKSGKISIRSETYKFHTHMQAAIFTIL